MKNWRSRDLISLSFFSGALGLDLGLERAGIQQVLASEIDKSSVQTIISNRPNLPVIGNILDYSSKEIRTAAGLGSKDRPTLIVGGPPCQAFSTAGKRQAFTDPRGNVFLRYLEIIRDLEPEYAVIENVRGLLSASLKHRSISEREVSRIRISEEELPGSALNLVLRRLKSYGYTVSFNLYNAANFGVPQIRERIILIAVLDKPKLGHLHPTHSEHGNYGLEKWVTFRQATKGLVESKMHGIEFPDSRIKYLKLLGPGENWRNLPSEKMKKEALGNSYLSGGGKTGFLRRLDWNSPAPTLVTHPAMPATSLAHPKMNRPLTVEEYKRLQQFPDDWQIQGSILNQYKQIGNAVPIGLGYAVGKLILADITGEKHPDPIPEFPFSRYKNTNEVSWTNEYKQALKNMKSDQLEFGY